MVFRGPEPKPRAIAYIVAEHSNEDVEKVSVAADGPAVAFRPITFALVVQCKKERRATELVGPCFNISTDGDGLSTK